MTVERSLADALVARLRQLTVRTLLWYSAATLLGFAVLSEVLARHALGRSADVIESLLGMYADPGGERTTVAPDMLTSALLGVGNDARFVILRTVDSNDGMPKVYYLSPGMPAKLIEQAGQASSPDAVRREMVSSVTGRGWPLLYHRAAGDFDLYVSASRWPMVLALGGLVALSLLLLPIVAWAAHRAVRASTAVTLRPLHTLVEETHGIRPTELSRRVTAPTGIEELTGVGHAINELVARVEGAHQALTQFTADVSHELRTPLTHLRAQAQWALDERRTPEELRESLGAIGTSVDQACQLIEGLLLIARGDSRELTPRVRDFDLGVIADEVAELGGVMCVDKPVAVTTDHPTAITAHGDPAYTRQILLNFVSNAARHTPSGHIVVAVRRAAASVIAEVRDSGSGISAEHLPRVFDRFYRVEASRSRQHGGAGLGLAIARTLAHTQRARVDATSTEGAGSTFILDLAADRNAWEARPTPANALPLS
ncbi:MAG: hypothetical protein IPK85_07995 [Gemmatimonadetes bacterium]|nr:hypothetical protein [Gemmatimonadota bacterium]